MTAFLDSNRCSSPEESFQQISPRAWRYGANLACPHATRIELGIADNFRAAWDFNHTVPLRKDGYWPKAMRCDECNRVRAVASMFIELLPSPEDSFPPINPEERL